MSAELGECPECGGKQKLLMPLYGEKGGPLTCIPCGMDWHAAHSRKRKLGRIVTKAIKGYLAAGGGWDDVDRLKLAAVGVPLYDFEADTIGADVGDITLELLEAAVRLTHPDRHPPERQEAARLVTQELLALKPFVFPAPKEKPVERNASTVVQRGDAEKPLRIEYPCELCLGQIPMDYCNDCKAEHKRRRQKEAERERGLRRAAYKRRRQLKLYRLGPWKCATCGDKFKPKRTDARYCSAACRQKAHRERVTEKPPATCAVGNSRYAGSVA
jgi:hypothetical protein